MPAIFGREPALQAAILARREQTSDMGIHKQPHRATSELMHRDYDCFQRRPRRERDDAVRASRSA